ncbi:hypothetical protein AAE478_000607 [Parahypoxylon ruwenzoriense]
MKLSAALLVFCAYHVASTQVDSQPPGFDFNVAANGVRNWLAQSGKDIKKVVGEIDSDATVNDVSNWFGQAGKDIKKALGDIDFGDNSRPPAGGQWGKDTPLPGFIENPRAHFGVAMADVGSGVEGVMQWASEWVQEAKENLQTDPKKTMLNAVGDGAKVALLFAPGLFWGPAVNLLGFSTAGVRAGTTAAAAHSRLGPMITSGSPISFLQSAGAGGYGARAMDAMVRGGVVASEAAWHLAKRIGNGQSNPNSGDASANGKKGDADGEHKAD